MDEVNYRISDIIEAEKAGLKQKLPISSDSPGFAELIRAGILRGAAYRALVFLTENSGGCGRRNIKDRSNLRTNLSPWVEASRILAPDAKY